MRPGQLFSDSLTDITDLPGTGKPFAGLPVPQWDDAVSLAETTHLHFPTYVILAFDIAPTPSGPVIVEANARGDLNMVQHLGGRPIGQTVLPEILLSHLP